MAEALSVTLHAMGEEPAGSQSAAVDIGTRRSAARLVLEVLEGSGATLNVALQTSNSSSGPWKTIGTFPTVEGPARIELGFAGLLQYVRISWTQVAIVTFAVAGSAHTLYATPAQIKCAPGVLEGVTASAKAIACIEASGEAEGYLNRAYTAPLTAWPPEVTHKTGKIAAWNIVVDRGIRPDGADEIIGSERDMAIKWFDKVGAGHLRPPGIVDSTPDTYEAGGYVVSDTA